MNRKNVEDLYPLTPLQEGMLFHALHSPQADAYAEQVTLALEGEVRPEAFAAAWQAVVDRTPALRTGFVWEGVKQPMQVVFRQASVPVRVEDWSALPDAERESRWAALLDEDRAAGWELRRAPLVRMALARMGGREWRFLLSTHHLLVDGWSLGLMFADFSAAYDAALGGREIVLARRPAFRDYVAWIVRRPADAAEAFWRARLGGVDEPTPLPLDRAPARAGRPAEEHGQVTEPLSAELAAALAEAARRHRVTAGTLVQAAWAVVLARYTGRDEVVFGTTVSGRPPEVPGIEEMVGLFINTVPVLVRVPARLPTAEWIAALHHEQAEARDHELAPLARVRAWSGLPGEAPLFETLFVYENFPMGAAGAGDEEPPFVVTGARAAERTNYALSLVVAPAGGAMRATATYDARRLDEARVRALLAAYLRVLEQLVSGRAATVGALELLRPEERDTVLEGWNCTAVPYPSASSIHRLFAEQAARTPAAVAVTSGDASLGYAELDAAANRLAHHLAGLGVGPESRVGVCLERGPETVVAILAVLKAGGAYVPLDPAYPRERLAFMLADSGVAVLVTREGLRAALPADGVAVVCIDREGGRIVAEPSTDLSVETGPRALAYVIYTSGSTGTPRGVAVEHRGVVRLVRGADYASFGPDEVVLQASPVSFDASTLELWGALLNGGRLVIPGPNPSLEELGRAVVRHGVTTLWLTAGLFQVMVQERLEELAGVRQLLAGGDVLPVDAVARVRERFPALRLINGYGPTENTTFTCCHTVGP